MLTAISFTGSFSIYATLLLLAVYFVASIRSYKHLSHIPGPRSWGWSVAPLFWVHLQGEIFDKFNNLSRQYGPIVRVSPNALLVSDPDVLRRISAARSPYTRAEWYIATRLTPGKDNCLSTRDEKRHDELRRKMAASYSGKDNLSLEADIDECVLDLMQLIDHKYTTTAPAQVRRMELARKIQFFTSDIMSKLSFDAKFNDLRDDNDNFGYIHEIETLFPNIFCTCTVPSLLNFLERTGIMSLMAPSGESKFGLGKILAITQKQVAARFDKNGKPAPQQKSDMLASFIRHGLTQDEAEQESMLQLAAGSDTTATGIRATLLCIFTNPRVHSKLLAEISAFVASSGASLKEEDAIISDTQARQLPYLQACIKEGLRWFPPITGMLPKKVPQGGDTICGYAIPTGTDIGYSMKAIHHSPILYGPDETVFRPERWILQSEGGDEPDPEKVKAMERNNELLFGSGKYQCLGKSIAAMELNKVIFEVVRRFQVSLNDPLRPWVSTCFEIHLQREMWVTVERREGMAADKG